MHEIPLPPHPDLQQYKKRAKELVAAVKSGDPAAVRRWAEAWLLTLAGLLGHADDAIDRDQFERVRDNLEAQVRERAGRGRFALADAQLFLARAHGFESWAGFAGHLERPFRGDPRGREFEATVDAIVTGDLHTLEALLRGHPELVRAQSSRPHRATLLHYVAANGVEDWRQLTPPNAVTVARLLLDAGAEVDALAGTYGGGSAQTTMNLLVSSAHPAIAGLQGALVDVLCDFGAAVNGLEDDESPLMTALAFGYAEPAETLARRGARVDTVIAAAALGRSDLIQRFVSQDGTLGPDVPLISPGWWRLPSQPSAHLELAMVWACRFGRAEVVDLLLGRGVNPAAKDHDRMTCLHLAAAGRHMEVVRLLLSRGVSLEARNAWDGTVLGSTLYFARTGSGPPEDYAEVIRALVDAGADPGALGAPGRAMLNHLLRDEGA